MQLKKNNKEDHAKEKEPGIKSKKKKWINILQKTKKKQIKKKEPTLIRSHHHTRYHRIHVD
jgi:hypothetical protein